MNSTTIVTNYPSVAYDGEPTFAGLIQNYFVEYDSHRRNIGISRYWNEKTAASCLYDYERRILKGLDSICGKETPAHALTSEIFEQLLQNLAAEHHYSDGTLNHYRHLIRLAYQAGVEHDHYPDTLFWEDMFDAETASGAEKEAWRARVMTRLRKSFSIEEEMRLVQWFTDLDPITASGEDVGLLLMFSLGLRNNEVCGANYGSIHPLAYHPDTMVFDMVQSTRLNSAELKSGGKTGNAPRTLLMMEPVWDFIQKRRTYLAAQVENGSLVLPESASSVDDLPVVCKKTAFTQRASSGELSVAGRALFNRIEIDHSELSALFQTLCSTEMQLLQLEEREPTTYLFRRNCATHLYQLGFTPSEIQYWMGHEIEDPFTKRSFFADSDQLYALKEKWERHPVLTLLSQARQSDETITALPFRSNNPEWDRLHIVDCQKANLLICVETQEPMTEITLAVRSNASSFPVECQMLPHEVEYPRSAAIAGAVNRAYRKRMEGRSSR